MSNVDVGIFECIDYKSGNVRNALQKILMLFEDEFRNIKPGTKVLLKANLCTPTVPEKAATTHPSLLVELSKILLDLGAQVKIADDPIAPNVASQTLQLSGINSAFKGMPVETAIFALDKGFRWVDVPKGIILSKANFANEVLDADYIINVPKLKTHILTQMSCSIKNFMGCIERAQRKEIHVYKEKDDFAAALLDIYRIKSANFTIVDGVVGMVGLGPSNGIPANIGYIVASTNAYAVDYAAAKILGYNPMKISTIKLSKKHKLFDDAKIEYCGINPENCNTLKLPLAPNISDAVRKRFAKQLSLYLKVNIQKCIKCGECVKQCPSNAISKNPIDIDYTKCQMCFCCFELCPKGAIEFTIPSILGNQYTLTKEEMYDHLNRGESI